VTSYTNGANISKCYDVGMVDVLNKPIDSRNLKTILDDNYFGQLAAVKKASLRK